jgi:hypothetical protein
VSTDLTHLVIVFAKKVRTRGIHQRITLKEVRGAKSRVAPQQRRAFSRALTRVVHGVVQQRRCG